MVPTLTCGLSRSNFSFATFCSLLYRLVCPPLWRRTSEIYLNAVFVDCTVLLCASCCVMLRALLSGRNRFPRPLFDDLLGDAGRNLLCLLYTSPSPRDG